MVQRKSIKVHRCSIQVPRTTIKLPMTLKCAIIGNKLNEATRESDTINIKWYYEKLVCKSMGWGYHCSSDKNWIHFLRVREICRMKEWDYQLYLDSQFYKLKDSRPYPSNLYSKRALVTFTNYLATIKKNYRGTLGAGQKQKGKKVLSLEKEVVESIISSVDLLSTYIQDTDDEEKREQTKILKLYHSWEQYSPYYLYSLPWFHDIIGEFTPSKKLDELRHVWELIEKSKRIREIVKSTVEQSESHFGIPSNLDL